MTDLIMNKRSVWQYFVLALAFISAMCIGTVARADAPTPPSSIGEAVVLIDADNKEIYSLRIPINGCIRQALRKW